MFFTKLAHMALFWTEHVNTSVEEYLNVNRIEEKCALKSIFTVNEYHKQKTLFN